MEQQTISITKCGVNVNLPSNVVILAAANPVGSFYDKSKTLKENVKISAPLLSRFDLVYQLGDQDKSSDDGFMAHLSNRSKSFGNTSQSFFNSQQSVNKEKLSWLKLQPGERIDAMPLHLLQFYIGHARENSIPTMTDEAKKLIIDFFIKLRQITTGNEAINVTFRQLEGIVRLSMARARADLSEAVLKEHVTDVINLFKFTMTDVFADESIVGDGLSFVKVKTQNFSSMSKPKQTKAFIEHLRDLDIEEHSTAELKSIAKELGIKDFYEILDKLNHAGELLKTANGYRVVD
jgi:DNA helicase MCM8